MKIDWIYCPDCNGEGSFETISDCCCAERETDLGLCYECHDHCEPMECDSCNGAGKIETVEPELL